MSNAAPAKTFGSFSPREITIALAIAVAVIWLGILLFVLHRQPILGGDFMEFYVFGAIARAGEWALQYDWPAFHNVQVALIPGSSGYVYAPAYPPLVPAVYAPFAALPFEAAFAAWAVASAALYVWLMNAIGSSCDVLSRSHVLLGTLIFPPFIAAIVLGQSTLWPLLGFVTGWFGLTRGRPFLAGLCFSIVAMKPHFGIGLALVLVFSASWRVVAGVVIGLMIQAGLTLWVCGYTAGAAYLTTTLSVLRDPSTLEPVDPRHTHAVRASLAAVLPAGLVLPVWLVTSAAVGWIASWSWRREESWPIRMASLLFASLLVSPHVLVYDGVLLAPAVVWFLDRALAANRMVFAWGLALVSVTFVVPAARIAGVPLTLPLMLWLLWRSRSLRPVAP